MTRFSYKLYQICKIFYVRWMVKLCTCIWRHWKSTVSLLRPYRWGKVTWDMRYEISLLQMYWLLGEALGPCRLSVLEALFVTFHMRYNVLAERVGQHTSCHGACVVNYPQHQSLDFPIHPAVLLCHMLCWDDYQCFMCMFYLVDWVM